MPERRAVLAVAPAAFVTLTAGCTGSAGSVMGGGSGDLPQEKAAVVKRYDEGVTAFNDGATAWNEGTDAFNNADYERAVSEFERSVGNFETAQQVFTESREKSRQLGQDDAADLCEESRRRSELMFRAASAGRDGARAAADGANTGTINKHMNEAQEFQQKAEALTVADVETVRSALREG